MEDFIQMIKKSDDRNFLLAVKYSNILDLAQERLDALKLAAKPAQSEEPLPAEVSLPAIRDTPEKAAAPERLEILEKSSAPAILEPAEAVVDTHAYPESVELVDSEPELRAVLSKHEDKFTVVKLGADWCKPCKKVAPGFHHLVTHNESTDIVYAVCDMTSRSQESKDVQQYCGCQRIPYFAVFKAGSLLGGLQCSDIERVTEFINTTVEENTMGDMMFGDDDF